MPKHDVVSREAWLAARRELLAEEKAFNKARDALSERRRALPWTLVDKPYTFEGPSGRETLAELFGPRSQLLVYHFMYGPDWEQGCPSCSFMADHLDGMAPHLSARDVTLLVVSRAPLAQVQRFQRRMGWRFRWVSSHGSDFNHDFGVSFTPLQLAQGKVPYNYTQQPFPAEEAPGISVFARNDAGDVFHTYSTYGRGVEVMMGTYRLLDLAPQGRAETNAAYTMDWVRHHDRYGAAATAAASSCCGEHA
jgi:predicted dithiol-disulfide oxidoreductase (DUF899 family)